jgi:SH3 domain protein
MNKLSSISFILLILLNFPVWSEEGTEPQDIPAAAAEPEEVQEVKYVTDKLRLSLYKQADSASGTIKLLVSGDKLDVLGRSGPYSRVRTLQGETGWVKNGFLVSSPTASNLLQDMEKQIEQLKADLEKYSDSQKVVQQYEQRLQQLQQEKQILAQELQDSQIASEELLQQKQQLGQELDRLQSRDNSLDPQMVLQIAIQYWYVVLAMLLIMFVIGLFIGRKIIEARINRRFQGVKVL